MSRMSFGSLWGHYHLPLWIDGGDDDDDDAGLYFTGYTFIWVNLKYFKWFHLLCLFQVPSFFFAFVSGSQKLIQSKNRQSTFDSDPDG